MKLYTTGRTRVASTACLTLRTVAETVWSMNREGSGKEWPLTTVALTRNDLRRPRHVRITATGTGFECETSRMQVRGVTTVFNRIRPTKWAK